MRNIDIVPTVAGAARTKVWWRHDGRSVFSPRPRARDRVTMPRRDFSRVISFGRAEFERAPRTRCGCWRAGKYGTGAAERADVRRPLGVRLPDRPAPGADRPAAAAPGAGTAHAEIANAALAAHVDPQRRSSHARDRPAAGRRRAGRTRDLAVAVNGRIRAVGPQLPPARPAHASSSRCSCRSRRCGRGATRSRCSRCGRAAAWPGSQGCGRVGQLARVAVEPGLLAPTSMKKQVERLRSSCGMQLR